MTPNPDNMHGATDGQDGQDPSPWDDFPPGGFHASSSMRSETPRTDAHEQRVAGPNAWSPHDFNAVPVNFARELEREMLALKKEVFVLRLYGNKDCTAMADARLAKFNEALTEI